MKWRERDICGVNQAVVVVVVVGKELWEQIRLLRKGMWG